MRNQSIKVLGLTLSAFSLGVIVQIFIPDIYIVMLFAMVLLTLGILILLKC